tara:strand:- start:1271 stop:2086 length:816 start_codon:yes stop_codon:yes gene_type:complete
MFRYNALVIFLALFLGVSCSDSGESVGSRTVVILTPDEVGEIVLPPGAFEEEVLVTLPPTTTKALVAETEEKMEIAIEDAVEEVVVGTPNDSNGDEKEAPVSSTTTTTISSTTTTTTTTTTKPPKETIPIAEEEENAGAKLMESLDDFNSCLSSEGYSFMGLPNQEAGPEDPVNNPDYLRALVLCNSRTNIQSQFQEFQQSRNELTPDEIREQNEQTIALGDCLKGKGWSLGDLAPDENGLLNPSQFSSPDGQINTDDIRSCASELSLEGE